MIRFNQLVSKLEESIYNRYEILSEKFHQEVESILNNPEMPASSKLGLVTKKVRELSEKGIDSGLENAKPKKGSSRAVLFSTTPESIHVDGKEAQVHTATKIAFKGKLDAYHGDSMLLGEHQNMAEADGYLQRSYSALRETGVKGHYEHNPEGCLLPILDESHSDGHWLKGVKLDKYSTNDMKSFTKNSEFPKGISHKEFKTALESEHAHCNGLSQPYDMRGNEDHYEKVKEHPYVNNAINMMLESGMHPADLDPRNMGTFVHPHTGVRHPVILDYGYNNEISKLYSKARQNMIRRHRGY